MSLLVNFIPSARSTMRSKSVTRSFDPTNSLGGGYTQASITFFSSKVPSIRVTVLPKFLKGKRSNASLFGLYLQIGVRYFCTAFGLDGTQRDGNVSTAGGAGGYGATDAGAVVSKINSSNLKDYVSAQLYKNATNVDYTGAGGIGFANALRMRGGRG